MQKGEISLASIKNLEKNLIMSLNLMTSQMLDYNPQRSDYENWISFTLILNSPDKNYKIDEIEKGEMTVFETKNLLNGIKNLLNHLENNKRFIYKFNSSEAFFDLELEGIPEDDLIEIILWINIGSQTQGKLYGFDKGVRFATDKESLGTFLSEINEDYLNLGI